MAQFPALPLFTDAYLADTTHLTTIEHGAYLLLLIVAWRSPDCGLPTNSRELMKYTKLSSGQFKRIWPSLEPFFYEENDRLFQGRLLDELETVRRLTQQRSDAGKASALKRNKRNQRALVRNGNEKQAPTPTPTPTPNKDIINGYHFEDFYKLYPIKKARKKAETIYNKIIKSGVKHEDLVKGLSNYLADIKSNKTEIRFIKHPTTWLNQECWNDEYNSKPKRKRL